jgi:predicted metal-binding membrane protein
MTTIEPPPRVNEAASGLRATLVLVFGLSAWYTIRHSRGVTTSMPLPDGSTMWMSTDWTMLTFSTMWLLMMLAMMLPSAWRSISTFRRVAVRRLEPHADALAVAMTVGYFAAWMVFGVLAFASGRAFRSTFGAGIPSAHTLGLATGAGLVLAGFYQLTPWKMDCLEHCRDPLHFAGFHSGGGWLGATRIGLTHGCYCVGCCTGLMAIQLLLGIMSLPVMVAIASVIAAEKLLPQPVLVARGTGLIALVAGAALVGRSMLL